MDREKVIKGLECCAGQCNYHSCPYKDPCENANGVKQIMLDAIVLLKEQEAKTGKWIEQDGYDGDVYYDCSACGESWVMIDGSPQENGMLYCPHCGAKMEAGEEG